MTHKERARLRQLLLYVAQRAPGGTAKKLFKLLYLLDVAQVRSCGRTVTGLTYAAYTPGPVPWQLNHWLEALPADFAEVVHTNTYTDAEGKTRHVVSAVPGAVFNDDLLSNSHLSELDELLRRFRAADEQDIDVTEFDGGAWRATLDQKGREEVIDWGDVIDADDPHRDIKISTVHEQQRHARGVRSAVH